MPAVVTIQPPTAAGAITPRPLGSGNPSPLGAATSTDSPTATSATPQGRLPGTSWASVRPERSRTRTVPAAAAGTTASSVATPAGGSDRPAASSPGPTPFHQVPVTSPRS